MSRCKAGRDDYRLGKAGQRDQVAPLEAALAAEGYVVLVDVVVAVGAVENGIGYV